MRSKRVKRRHGENSARTAKVTITLTPLLSEEGWRDGLIEAGAAGAEREPDRAKPQLWSVRLNFLAGLSAGLTTPSAPSLRSAQPPLLCEEGNSASHTHCRYTNQPRAQLPPRRR